MKPAGLFAICLLLTGCASVGPSPLWTEGEGGGAEAPPPAQAGDDKGREGVLDRDRDWGRKGAYASIGALFGFEQFDGGAGTSADDSDLGLAFRAGYRMERKIALEVVLEDAMDFELGSGPFSADLDIWSFGVQGKYYFSEDKTQPYVLAGLGIAQASLDQGGDDEGTYFRLGGGVDHYLSRDVALFGELNYNHLMGGVDDLDHLDFLVGILLRF